MSKLFSINIVKEPRKFSKKIITFLGIKIKFNKPEIEDILELLPDLNFKINLLNKNFIFFVYNFLNCTTEKELLEVSETAHFAHPIFNNGEQS